MSDTAADHVHVVTGQLADNRLFGLLHRGDGHPHTIIGRSMAELHRRLTNAGISEFRMQQEDATGMATDAINHMHDAMEAPPPPSQLEELQQEVLLVTAERDKALAQVAKLEEQVAASQQFRNAGTGQYESGETHDAGKGEADG